MTKKDWKVRQEIYHRLHRDHKDSLYGYDILMSDDISMKALKYDLVTNAKKALEAGCNLVLYCEGKIKDNLKLIKSVPYIDKFTVKKTSEIYKILR